MLGRLDDERPAILAEIAREPVCRETLPCKTGIVYSADVGSDEKLLVRDGSGWVERQPSPGLAAKLSRDHETFAVEWSIHTAVDQIWIVAYRAGEVVRELRYAVSDGWTKRGKALPFEDTARLGKLLRKRRLLASPDGYEVLDAFLGKQPPAPAVSVNDSETALARV